VWQKRDLRARRPLLHLRRSALAASIAGAQRFADSELHDKALALGWSWDELYGDHGAARVLGNDRALYVTRELIMACSPQGEAKPIYRGVGYGS
jgi:hypothetical protein